MLEEGAIPEVLTTYEAAWNKHDLAAWAKLFTDDVDYVNRDGSIWKGNEANIAGHQAIHQMLKNQDQNMSWTVQVNQISNLSPDIALVHATWEWPCFRLPSGIKLKDFRGILTLVMVQRENRWLIRALHNTVADPASTS